MPQNARENEVFSPSCEEEMKFAAIFNNGVVIQQEEPFWVWGTSEQPEVIVALLDAGGEPAEQKTVRVKDGKFACRFPGRKGSYDAYTLSLSGRDGVRQTVRGVVFGEVFLAAGQSNMELIVRHFAKRETLGQERHPFLRFVSAKDYDEHYRPVTFTGRQEEIFHPRWQVADNREDLDEMSGLCLQCFSVLQKEIEVPIGIYDVSVGGTQIETWLTKYLDKLYAIRKIRFRAMLWYQGEANAKGFEAARNYCKKLILLVKRYRQLFAAQFPVVALHILPNYYVNGEFCHVYVNEAIDRAMKSVSQGWSLASYPASMDYLKPDGQTFYNPIHPNDKTKLARDLRITLRDILYRGISRNYGVRSVERRGNTAEIECFERLFKNKNVFGFSVCGADGVFYPAQAKVTESRRVRVTCDRVLEIRDIRYATYTFPAGCNLRTWDGIPILPFRTDTGPVCEGQWNNPPYCGCLREKVWVNHNFFHTGGADFYPVFVPNGIYGTSRSRVSVSGGKLRASYRTRPADHFGVHLCAILDYWGYRTNFSSYKGLRFVCKNDNRHEIFFVSLCIKTLGGAQYYATEAGFDVFDRLIAIAPGEERCVTVRFADFRLPDPYLCIAPKQEEIRAAYRVQWNFADRMGTGNVSIRGIELL